MDGQSIDSYAALRRTAILLTTLDRPTASELLGRLPPLKQAALRRTMAELTDVDPLERRQALKEFRQKIANPAGAANARLAERSEVFQALPSTQTEPTFAASARHAEGTANTPLAFLSEAPDHVLLHAIRDEHPQTIAIVLASLQPIQAARLISQLEATTRQSAIQRLAKLDQLPTDALAPIEQHLRELVERASPASLNTSGSRSLQAIMDALPGGIRTELEQTLGLPGRNVSEFATANYHFNPSAEGATAASIRLSSESNEVSPVGESSVRERSNDDEESRQVMIASLDQAIEHLSGDQIRQGLAKLPADKALLAMCGLAPHVATKVLATLPRKQARAVERELAALAAVTLRQIDHAKLALAESLELHVTTMDHLHDQTRLLSAAA